MAITSKLKLFLPQGSDLADVEVSLNPQLNIIDKEKDVLVCTSIATFPLNPYIGKLAWATDVRSLYYWSGADWTFILSREDALGRMAYVSSNATGPNVGKNDEKGPYLSATFRQITGRIYKVSYTAEVDSPNTANFGSSQIRIRFNQSNSVSLSDPIIYWGWADHMKNGTTFSTGHSGSFTYTAVADGQVTMGMFLWRGDLDGTLFLGPDNHNNLMIEDVGWRQL